MGLALATLLVAVVMFVRRPAGRVEANGPPDASAVANVHRLTLHDGSEAILLQDADIAVEEQTSSRVRLIQQSGAVRYEVKPEPSRAFSVRAGSAIVHVRGTIFTVRLLADNLEVSVERGRVEVEEGGRTLDLIAGESLRIPTEHARLLPSNAAPGSDANLDAMPTAPPAASAPASRTADVAAGAPKRDDDTPAALLRAADRAREDNRHADAATALETLVRRHPRDGSVPGALFTLGRVETARGRHASAAHAFERCAATAPNGPLADDATSGAALAWASAGRTETARIAAGAYLERWPNGIHAAQMRALRDR